MSEMFLIKIPKGLNKLRCLKEIASFLFLQHNLVEIIDNHKLGRISHVVAKYLQINHLIY